MLTLTLVAALLTTPPTPIRDAVRAVSADTFPASQPLLATRVPNRAERILLKVCMAVNVGGNAYDATTTIRAIDSGRFVEGNPALRWIGDEPRRIIPVKAAYVAGTTWAFISLADDHPRIAAAAACVSGAVSTWAGSRNRRAMAR